MITKSRCDRCRKPLYGLVPCPACRELMIAEAIEQDRAERADWAERAARPDNGLPVLDEAYGKTPTYEVAGRCLTCGARFIVRREKGVKPPLSVDCPHCGCTEFGWQDLHYPLAPAQPAPSCLAATLDRLEAAVRSYEHEEDWPAVEDALAALRAAPAPDAERLQEAAWLAENRLAALAPGTGIGSVTEEGDAMWRNLTRAEVLAEVGRIRHDLREAIAAAGGGEADRG